MGVRAALRAPAKRPASSPSAGGSSRKSGPHAAEQAAQPPTDLSLLGLAELIVAIVSFLTDVRHLVACSGACRTLRQAVLTEATWERAWAETVRDKVFVPPAALRMVKAKVPLFRSALRLARADATRTAITPEELTSLTWERRAKYCAGYAGTRNDPWHSLRRCRRKRYGADGRILALEPAPTASPKEAAVGTWRFVRRLGDKTSAPGHS